MPPRRLPALARGVAVTFGAIATTTAAAFLTGTAVAGAGFGLGFSGAFRMTIVLATPSQSAGLVTAGSACGAGRSASGRGKS